MEFGKVMWHPLGTTEGLCLFKNNEMEGSTAVWKQGLQVFSEWTEKQSRKSLEFCVTLASYIWIFLEDN